MARALINQQMETQMNFLYIETASLVLIAFGLLMIAFYLARITGELKTVRQIMADVKEEEEEEAKDIAELYKKNPS